MIAISVLGAGSWGTALALQLARNGHRVTLWGHNPQLIASITKEGRNRRYLPDIAFPKNLIAEPDLESAVTQAQRLLVAVPSHGFAQTLTTLLPYFSPAIGIIWATKGLEPGTGLFLHQVVQRTFAKCAEKPAAAVVSGPSFAREVGEGLPTAVTVASNDDDFALTVAKLLHGSGMLAYTSSDISGVELGGAVKNVLAIAAGIADGLGYGANSRSALITRGLAEMVRLGETLGGLRETFMGLTGVGDLVLTCTDNQSRNRRFGLAIGQGKSFADARLEIGQVVEGAAAVLEIMRMANKHQIELPICAHVEQVLYHGMTPREAVRSLLSRPPRPELD